MRGLQLLHGVAAAVNGLALAGALYAPRLSVVCCVASSLLLIASGEKLRFALVTRPTGERPRR